MTWSLPVVFNFWKDNWISSSEESISFFKVLMALLSEPFDKLNSFSKYNVIVKFHLPWRDPYVTRLPGWGIPLKDTRTGYFLLFYFLFTQMIYIYISIQNTKKKEGIGFITYHPFYRRIRLFAV